MGRAPPQQRELFVRSQVRGPAEALVKLWPQQLWKSDHRPVTESQGGVPPKDTEIEAPPIGLEDEAAELRFSTRKLRFQNKAKPKAYVLIAWEQLLVRWFHREAGDHVCRHDTAARLRLSLASRLYCLSF